MVIETEIDELIKKELSSRKAIPKPEPEKISKHEPDIHELPFSERIKYLDKIPDSEHVKQSKRILCHSEAEVRKAIAKVAKEEGSEGAYLKLSTFPYKLTGRTNQNVKHKNEIDLDAVVLKKNKVKGTEKTFYYHCGLKSDSEIVYCGKTFNTNIDAPVGGIIKVVFVDVSGYTTKEGKRWCTWWSPRPVMLRTDKKEPDTIDTAWRMVRDTTGRFEDREMPDIKNLEQLELVAKGKRFVIQSHARGSSFHLDFRVQINHVLEGFTIAVQHADILKDELDKHWKLEKSKDMYSLFWDGELAYQLDKKENIVKEPSAALKKKIFEFHVALHKGEKYWKVDLHTGEEKKRKGVEKEEVEKIFCVRKGKESYDWLDVEGVTKPREIEPEPGGSRFYPGIFVKVDEGAYYQGANKSYFKEFFLAGKKWKGRIVFRLVAGLKGTKAVADWLYWKPDSQSPYVLCFTPSNVIYTPDGIKKVEDIEIDDLIYSEDFKNDQIISNQPIIYSGDVFYIKPRYLSGIEVTEEHPIFVREIKRVNDRLNFTSDPFWVKPKEMGEISKYRRLTVAVPKIKEEIPFVFNLKRFLIRNTANKNYGSFEMDPDIAYFFGLFAAEGSAIPEKGTIYLVLNIKEKEFANRIKLIVEEKFSSTVQIRYSEETHSQRIEIYNAPLSRFLEMEFGRGAKNKKIPNWLLLERKPIIKAFMSGLSDGDGCITKCHYAGSSENLARMSQLLLLKLGIVSSYYKSNYHSTFGEGVLHSTDISFNDNANSSMYFEDENYFWFPILEVKKHKFEGLVYPLSCNDSVLLSPFISHNSSHAIKDNWLPDEGSAMSPEWERKLPAELHFWKAEKGKRAEVRKLARKYLLQKKMLSVESSSEFILTRRHWKGAHIIRGLEVEDWHLLVNSKKFHLDKDPSRTVPEVGISALGFEGKEEFFKEGKKQPKSEVNPNLKIPAFIEEVDSGLVEIITDEPIFILVRFKGKKLKGLFEISRTSKQSQFWTLKKFNWISVEKRTGEIRLLKEAK